MHYRPLSCKIMGDNGMKTKITTLVSRIMELPEIKEPLGKISKILIIEPVRNKRASREKFKNNAHLSISS